MSSYGSAIVVDVPADADQTLVTDALVAMDGDTYTLTAPDGWQRATSYVSEIEKIAAITDLLKRVGTARAAVAEDYDEFGALWVVLSADSGDVKTVHRRYVLNADPNEQEQVAEAIEDVGGTDPRTDDVPGASAAAATARLFGVDPDPMVEAEEASDRAFEELGVVGGPFPWWNALGLPWPEPGAGDPVGT